MIKVNMIQVPSFQAIGALKVMAIQGAETSQTQEFTDLQIQNGYGNTTKVSVTPGYGATVSAAVEMNVNSVTEATFNQMINEVKKSYSYENKSQFKQYVNEASYTSAGSYASGIFGWLVGGKGESYTNKSTVLTNDITKYEDTSINDDVKVANSVANIMVKQSSKVRVSATIQVTGQLLTPSPTIIAVEATTFKYTDNQRNTSSVTMLNQSPVVPVNAENGTVSGNSVAPGSQLSIVPIGG